MMFGKKQELLRQDLISLVSRVDELQDKIAELKPAEKPTLDFSSRLADVEVKLAKLWTVLVKIDERGTERPTNTARKMFGGKSKQLMN